MFVNKPPEIQGGFFVSETLLNSYAPEKELIAWTQMVIH